MSNLKSTDSTNKARCWLRARTVLLLTIIPGSPKRLLRMPNRTSMKIDFCCASYGARKDVSNAVFTKNMYRSSGSS
jgi:hypothetical protein